MTTADTDAQHKAQVDAEEAFYAQCEAETQWELRSVPLWRYVPLATLTLLMLSLAFAAEKRAAFIPQPVHSFIVQKGH